MGYTPALPLERRLGFLDVAAGDAFQEGINLVLAENLFHMILAQG